METKDSRESNGLIKQRKWRRIIEYMKEGGKAAKCISDRNACARKKKSQDGLLYNDEVTISRDTTLYGM